MECAKQNNGKKNHTVALLYVMQKAESGSTFSDFRTFNQSLLQPHCDCLNSDKWERRCSNAQSKQTEGSGQPGVQACEAVVTCSNAVR